MLSPLSKLVACTAALAMCVSPSAAFAATAAPVRSISPLVAVSLFGTQASAQEACGNAATAAAAGAAAAVAQGQAGCVLPATDAAPPPLVEQPAPPPGGNYGINWLLTALGVAAFLGGLSTLFDDDDAEISPA